MNPEFVLHANVVIDLDNDAKHRSKEWRHHAIIRIVRAMENAADDALTELDDEYNNDPDSWN